MKEVADITMWVIHRFDLIFSFLSENSAMMIESSETLSREPLSAELRWDLDSDFAGFSVKLQPL